MHTRTAASVLAATLALTAAPALGQDDAPAGALPEREGAVVEGTAVSANGKDVDVALWRRCSTGAGYSIGCGGGAEPRRFKSGKPFRFTGLQPGAYVLRMDAEGCATAEREVPVFAHVAVGEVQVPAACRVEGKAVLAFAGDMEQVWVSVVSGETIRASGRPAADGSFAFDGLAPGEHWLLAQHGPHFHGEKQLESLRVTLLTGANRHDVRIEKGETVEFVVRSSRPAEFVEGQISSPDAPAWNFGGLFRVLAGEEGARMAGQATFGYGLHWQKPSPALPVENAPRGRVPVRVEAIGFETWERTLDLAARSRDVTGRARVDVELVRLPGAFAAPYVAGEMVAVQVRRAGEPWTPLLVRDRRRHRTHESEGFSERAFLAPGTYEVSASSLVSPPTAPRKLEVSAGSGTIEMTFDLEAGRRLGGRLVSASGKPICSVDLFCFRKDGASLRALPCQSVATHLESGAFTITGLGAGEHVLALDEAGAHPVGTFTVEAGDVTRNFVWRLR